MKIISYDTSDNSDNSITLSSGGNSNSSSSSSSDISQLLTEIDNLKQLILQLNKLFVLNDGILTCIYPLASTGDVTAFNLVDV